MPGGGPTLSSCLPATAATRPESNQINIYINISIYIVKITNQVPFITVKLFLQMLYGEEGGQQVNPSHRFD